MSPVRAWREECQKIVFSHSNKILHPVIETLIKDLLLSQSLLPEVDLFYTSASTRQRKCHSSVFWRTRLGKHGRRQKLDLLRCSAVGPQKSNVGAVERVGRGKGEHRFSLCSRSSKPETCHHSAQADRKINDDEMIVSENSLPDLCPCAQIEAGVAPLLPARLTA